GHDRHRAEPCAHRLAGLVPADLPRAGLAGPGRRARLRALAHAPPEDPAAPRARAGNARAAIGGLACDVARAARRQGLPPLHAADVFLRRRQSRHDAHPDSHHDRALWAFAADADAGDLVDTAAGDDAHHPAVVAAAGSRPRGALPRTTELVVRADVRGVFHRRVAGCAAVVLAGGGAARHRPCRRHARLEPRPP